MLQIKSIGILFFYWATFILSIAAIFLHIGLVIILFGIFIIPLLCIHFLTGIHLHKIQSEKKLLLLSSLNLLFFSLVRIEGVHVISGNGLSNLLEFFEIYTGYYSEWENIFMLFGFISFMFQLYFEARLLEKWKVSR